MISSLVAAISPGAHAQGAPVIGEIPDETIPPGDPYTGPVPEIVGGQPPEIWTLEEGPAGMTIDDATGQVSWPNPIVAGSPHIVTIQADSEFGSDTETWLLTVGASEPPIIGALEDQDAVAGVQFVSTTPTLVSGAAGAAWELVTGPSGMTIDPGTGVTTWDSPVLAGSPHAVDLRVTNAAGSDEGSYSVTVHVAPVVADISDDSAVVGTPYTGPTPTLTEGTPVSWELSDGPTGMTINADTGVVTWPSPVEAGSPHTVAITASNFAGSDDESWQVSVASVPVIVPIPDQTVDEGEEFIRFATATGAEPITWSLVNPPPGMSIDAGTGVLSWPSPFATVVPHVITLEATNVAGSDVEAFNLTVAFVATQLGQVLTDMQPIDTLPHGLGVTAGDDVAYVAQGLDGVVIVDIATPSAPQVIGSFDTPGYATGVDLNQSFTFVADWDSGLRIVESSDASNIVEQGSVFTGTFVDAVTAVDDVVYLADGRRRGGLQIYSVSEPTEPTRLGGVTTPGYAGDVAVSGDLAFVADGSNGLVIFDVSSTESIVKVGSHFDSPVAYTRGVAVVDDLAYVAAGVKGLQIIDVSDPSAPERLGVVGTNDYSWDLAVSSAHRVYLADGFGGLRVIDASDPTAPAELAVFDNLKLDPDTMPEPLIPASALDVAFGDGTACVVDQSGGLFLFGTFGDIVGEGTSASSVLPHLLQGREYDATLDLNADARVDSADLILELERD